MAKNDLTVYHAVPTKKWKGDYNIPTDTLKVGLIDNTITPLASDLTPSWDDYSANEVSTVGGYIAGGLTLTNLTENNVNGVSTINADDISLVQDLAGFTNAYWAIIYDSSVVGNPALSFVDLGGPVSEQDGPFAINWNAAGILRDSISNP